MERRPRLARALTPVSSGSCSPVLRPGDLPGDLNIEFDIVSKMEADNQSCNSRYVEAHSQVKVPYNYFTADIQRHN